MDISTNYMGLGLSSPIVCSSGPLSRDLGYIRQMEDCGAGAVVLWSLFEEQIEHDADQLEHYLHYGQERFGESITFFPTPAEFITGPEEYLEHIAKAKSAVDIPIIGSLNGISARGWTSYAHKMQDAGADAIELNVYYIPTDPALTGQQVEDVYVDILQTVRSMVSIPVAMKLSPYFSSLVNFVQRLEHAGANAIVLFNRFYQPDIDVENLAVSPHLEMSSPGESRLPLRWLAILYGKTRVSLAGTTGVYSGRDVVKMIMAGADVAMMCSALLKNGVEHLGKVRAEVVEIMKAMEYETVLQMKGVLSQASCPEPSAFERANYIKTLQSYGQTATLE